MSSLQFIVEGGRPLSGSIRPSGNKNAALPIVAAALLTDQPVTLENVPRIRDIETLVDLVRTTGAGAEWRGRNTLRIHAERLRGGALDPAMCARIRASILLAAPLLARVGEAELTPPGGDVIGRRRLDTHFLALEQLGARHDFGDRIRFSTRGLRGADVFLDEPSVTGTENAVMAAVAAKGTTTLHNVACEPHVQDLCRFLVAMGARIEGIGSNALTIHGGGALRGATHAIGPDHIEVGSFIGLAAVTKSEIRIEDAGVEHLRSIRLGFERLGVTTNVDGAALVVPARQSLEIQSDIGGAVPKLEDQPWPAFPADVMSIAIVTATQCNGLILMHEKMFESRMFFVDKLIGMGARIVLCDPHRALVSGPSPLRGATVESPDIRAGMAMLIAALCAKGSSVINNVGQIERGYERIHERLNALGAQITRVESAGVSAPAARDAAPEREAVAELARIGITAFTTTRAAGDFAIAEPEPAQTNLERWRATQRSLRPSPCGLVSARQVHATEIAEQRASWDDWRRLDGYDAHIVTAPVGSAAVTVADCVPVFIAHPSGAVAIVHAGWRGTAARLLPKTLARFEASAEGFQPGDIHVHLGPAICGRCYEVGPDVYEQLTGWQTIRSRFVDLRALLAEQAREAGVGAVSASAWCTRCDNDRFFSHRAGDAGRQISVIVAGVGHA